MYFGGDTHSRSSSDDPLSLKNCYLVCFAGSDTHSRSSNDDHLSPKHCCLVYFAGSDTHSRSSNDDLFSHTIWFTLQRLVTSRAAPAPPFQHTHTYRALFCCPSALSRPRQADTEGPVPSLAVTCCGPPPFQRAHTQTLRVTNKYLVYTAVRELPPPPPLLPLHHHPQLYCQLYFTGNNMHSSKQQRASPPLFLTHCYLVYLAVRSQ